MNDIVADCPQLSYFINKPKHVPAPLGFIFPRRGSEHRVWRALAYGLEHVPLKSIISQRVPRRHSNKTVSAAKNSSKQTAHLLMQAVPSKN